MDNRANVVSDDTEDDVVRKESSYIEPTTGLSRMDRQIDFVANISVTRPWQSLCSCYAIIVFVIIWGLFFSGAIQVPSGFYEWYEKDNIHVQHSDMLEASRVYDLDTSSMTQSSVSFYQLFLYKSKKDENIFTPKNLQAMCEFEKSFINFEESKKKSKLVKESEGSEPWYSSNKVPDTLTFDDFCVADSNGNCAVPDSNTWPSSTVWSGSLSVVYFFYETNLADSNGVWDCSLLDEAHVTTKSDYLVNQMATESGQLNYGFYMSKNANADGYTSITRSGIAVAGPLCMAKDGERRAGKCYDFASGGSDLFSDQALTYKNNLLGPWMYDIVKEGKASDDKLEPTQGGVTGMSTTYMFDDLTGNDGSIEMWTFSLLLQNWDNLRLLQSDQSYIFLSVAFVFGWIFMHTGSLFIASVGISQIFMSIPATIMPYAFILQVKYVGFMQFLVIFIILGVGADDVFVLVDAWKQSADDVPRGENSEETLRRRMKYALTRTATAVFNTSFTTAMAFFATAISPIMPISTFGIFSAVCIVINYIFVLTLTPSAIIINEMMLERQKAHFMDKEKAGIPVWDISRVFFACFARRCGCTHCVEGKRSIPEAPTVVAEPEKYRRYKNLVRSRKGAHAVIGLLTVLLCFLGYRASQLEPPLELERWLPDEHMLQESYDVNDKFVSKSDDEYATLQIVWGMKGLDDSDYNHWDPPCSCTKSSGCTGWKYSPEDCRGRTVYDDNFDLFDSETQTAIYEACNLMETWTCNAKDCEFGLLNRPDTTICFLKAFDSWVLSTKGDSTSNLVASGTSTARRTYMTYLQEFRRSAYPLDDASKSYDQIIGFTSKRSADYGPSYVQIQAKMTMPLLTPLAAKRPIERRAEKLLDEIYTPASAKHVFQYTFDWTWSVTQQGTVDGMSAGMAFAFPLALVVLVAVTANYVIAGLAIISVCAVVASVLGVCESIFGWSLGTGEAIAGVMVIGLAIDYTIHLGHMYVHAGRHEHLPTREQRFEYAVDKMMGTVIGGAITTCGAGFMMFFAIQAFFTKMATLLTFTIFFSFLYAAFWFMPILYWYGPSNNDFDIPFGQYYKFIRNKYMKEKGSSEAVTSVPPSDGAEPQVEKALEVQMTTAETSPI